MLDQNIIAPSNSPIATPVILVKKSDGSYCFCVDYRGLNLHTRKDAYHLPHTEDCLDSLVVARWFCTLDLCPAIGRWNSRKKTGTRLFFAQGVGCTNSRWWASASTIPVGCPANTSSDTSFLLSIPFSCILSLHRCFIHSFLYHLMHVLWRPLQSQ